ncbi:MAG TPA: hypothetical protein VIG44_00325 [Thermomicrobiales bacterium]|jgi:hypothetical protein
MDDVVALYTAAWRYVTGHAQNLRTRYFDRINEPDPPFAVWPRIAVLDALLVDIESVMPDQFSSLDGLRDYLLLAGATATSPRTKEYSSVATDLIDKERHYFRTYITNLTATDLHKITPLPYWRRLSAIESESVWDILNQRWRTCNGRSWYPLKAEAPSGVIAFQAAWFHHVISDEYLRSLLSNHRIKRCWELYEDGWACEMAVELLSTHHGHYEALECYATAGEMDWLIYASHESSITVAGDWLLEAVKAEWPEWEQHLYTGWDYKRPPKLEIEKD